MAYPTTVLGHLAAQINKEFNSFDSLVHSTQNSVNANFYLTNNVLVIPGIPGYFPLHGVSIQGIPSTAMKMSQKYITKQDGSIEFKFKIVGTRKQVNTITEIGFGIRNSKKELKAVIKFQAKTEVNDDNNAIAQKLFNIMRTKIDNAFARVLIDVDNAESSYLLNLLLNSLNLQIEYDTITATVCSPFHLINDGNGVCCISQVLSSSPQRLIKINGVGMPVFNDNTVYPMQYLTDNNEENKTLLGNNNLLHIGKQTVPEIEAYIIPVVQAVSGTYISYRNSPTNPNLRVTKRTRAQDLELKFSFTERENTKQALSSLYNFLHSSTQEELDTYGLLAITGDKKVLVIYGIDKVDFEECPKKEKLLIKVSPIVLNRQQDMVGYLSKPNNEFWFD